MADIGPARNSDPDPSHDAGKRTDVLKGRAAAFGALCKMIDGNYPPWELTRKTIRAYASPGADKDDTGIDTPRRRVSDLMCQIFKGGRWTPEVHFDLVEQVKGPDGKQLKFDGAGIVRLTAKGRSWKDHPEVRDWRWPHNWVDLPDDLL